MKKVGTPHSSLCAFATSALRKKLMKLFIYGTATALNAEVAEAQRTAE